MSQGTFPLSCSQSGQLFSDDLNSLLKGINSTNSGTTAPSSGLEEGVLWLDTSEAATPVLKIYDASVPGFIVLGVNGDSFKTVVIYKNSLVTPTPVPSSTNTVLNGTLDGFTAGGNTQSWSLTQTTPGTGADTYTSIGTFEQANSIGEYTTVGDWSTPAQLSGNDGSTGARSPIIGFYVPMVTRVIGTPTTFTSVLANFNPDGLLGTNTDNQAYLDASFSQFFFGNLTSDAVEGDYGVFYNNSVETENLVASYDAASGNWITGTKKISGNLLVDGSITADAISATAITGKIVKGGKNALDDITPSGFFFNSDGEFIIGGGSENIVFNGTNLTVPALTITGELVASQIAAGTITANEIATGTITATQLSADSITADKIASLELSVEKKLSVGNIKVGAEDELGAATVVSATSIEILDTGDFPTSGTVLIGGTESFTYTSKNADGVTFNSTTDTVEAVFAAGTVVQEVITGYAITFGTGVVLDGSGKFAVGSVDESLVFDGTNLVLSGVPIDANDLVEVASLNGRISASLQTFSATAAYTTNDVVIGPDKKIWRAKNDIAEPTAGTCTIGENDNRSACEGRGGIWTVTGTNSDPKDDSTNWEQISASVADTTYTAGDGLDLTGTVFSTDIKADSGLQITGANKELDLNLSASGITGTLDETDGGTGLTSYTTGDIMYASSANVLAKLTKGSSGQVLKMGATIPAWGTDNDNNTTYTAGDGLDLTGTVFSTDIKADSGLQITGANKELDLNLSASGITGTLDETDGGTGLTSYTTGDIMYASSANVLAKLTKGSSGQVLKMGATIPAWGTDNDNNTTYTAGDGLDLTGTVFSTDIKADSGLQITGANKELDLNLSASGITGTLDETDGGTGLTSYTTGDIMYASSANVLAKLTKGSSGQVLKMGATIPAWGTDNDNNTTYTAGDGLDLTGTVFSTDIKADSGLQITGANKELDLNLSASGITGTLDETDGGTGLTSYTTGDIMYASSANVLAKLTKGSSGQVLKMGATIPAWGTDNNTTYTAGSGIGLSTTTFSVTGGTSITADTDGVSVTDAGIGTTQLTDGAVSAAKLGDAVVNLEKIAVNQMLGLVFDVSYTDSSDTTPDSTGEMFTATSITGTGRVADNGAWSLVKSVRLGVKDSNGLFIGNVIDNFVANKSYIKLSKNSTNGATLKVTGIVTSGISGSGNARTGYFILQTNDANGALSSLGTFDQGAAYTVSLQTQTDAVVDGNLVVTGSLKASDITTGTLTATQITAANATIGNLVADYAKIDVISAGSIDTNILNSNSVIVNRSLQVGTFVEDFEVGDTLASTDSGFFVDSDGDMFVGKEDNYVEWFNDTLTVRGSLNAGDIKAGSLSSSFLTIDGNIEIEPPTGNDDHSIQGWADSTVRDWSPAPEEGESPVTGESDVPVANALDDILGLTASGSLDAAGVAQSGADAGSSGFFLGQTKEGPRFFIGDADGANSNFMKWNGSQLIVAGDSLVQLNASKAYYYNFNPNPNSSGGENGYNLAGSWCIKSNADTDTDAKRIRSSTDFEQRFVAGTQQLIFKRDDMNATDVGTSIYDNIGVGSTCRVTRVLNRTAEVVDFRVLAKTTVSSQGLDSGTGLFFEWFQIEVTVVSGAPADFLGNYSNAANDDHDIVEFAWRYFDDANQGIELGSILGSNSYGTHIVLGENAVADDRGSIVAIGRLAEGLGEDSIAIGDNATAGFQSVGSLSSNIDTGDQAIAIGSGAFAKGDDSIYIGNAFSGDYAGDSAIAIGRAASAPDSDGIAIGNSADASDADCIAIGADSQSGSARTVFIGGVSQPINETGSIAIGIGANTRTTNTTVIGTTVVKSIAIGNGADANTLRAIAIGTDSEAFGHDSIAIGSDGGVNNDQARAHAVDAIAIGRDADIDTTTATQGIAIGAETRVSKVAGVAIGKGAKVQGDDAIALGSGATANFANSGAFGSNATARAANIITLGGDDGADTPTDQVVELGTQTPAGAGADPLAVVTKAYLEANAGGDAYFVSNSDGTSLPTAPGDDAIAVGKGAIAGDVGADGDRSIAIGATALAEVIGGIAIGPTTKVEGLSGIAIGALATTGTDNFAMAVGVNANAGGLSSTAIGFSTKAVGNNSTALGNGASVADATGVEIFVDDLDSTSGLGGTRDWRMFNNDEITQADATSYTSTLSSSVQTIFVCNRGTIGFEEPQTNPEVRARAVYKVMETIRAGDTLVMTFSENCSEVEGFTGGTVNVTLLHDPTYENDNRDVSPTVVAGDIDEFWRLRVSITAADINNLPGVTTGSVLLTDSSGSFLFPRTVGFRFDYADSAANADNTIVLGNSDIDFLYCNASTISSLSDERDKADITDLSDDDGLPFINKLKPRTFYWDRRSWYDDLTPDGTKKNTAYSASIPNSGKRMGFIAQETEVAMEGLQCISDSNLVTGNPYQKEMANAELITPLVKAVQQLSEENDALKARLDALESL